MLFINIGNKSIYNTSVTGTLPSPQGDARSAETVDLSNVPPVKRSALSLVSAPAGTIYYPIGLFKWQDAASVQVARTIADDDRNTVTSTRNANYAVFGPAETRSNAEIIVDMFKQVGVSAVVRTDTTITGEDTRDIFKATAIPAGDLIVVSDFSSGYEVIKQIVQLTSYNTFVVDMELNGGGRNPSNELTAIKINNPTAAGYPAVPSDVIIYELVATDSLGPKPQSPNPDGKSDAQHAAQNDPTHDTVGSYHQVSPERYRELMAGPKERVVRHGTVSSLLATLNGAQFLALHGTAAVRAGLIERAIADADVIGTDVISVAITYPIKPDTYVDEELGERYDRSIVLSDLLVDVVVTRRMSRARRFMSWFLIPTAITAGIVAIVKDSVSIGRGRV